MEVGQDSKQLLVNNPSNVDDEGGKTIIVASNGAGGITLTDSQSGNDESNFVLRKTPPNPEIVTYQCNTQDFSLQFSANPPPVALIEGGSGPSKGYFQAAQAGPNGYWRLQLQANAAPGLAGKAFSYTVTLLGTGESHDPTMDIQC